MGAVNPSQLYSGMLVGCLIWEGMGDGVIRVSGLRYSAASDLRPWSVVEDAW